MLQAVHHSIAKPPIAKPSNASRPALYRRAIHREPSITTSTSRPLLHLQAVHRKLSIATLPSRPVLYCQAVQRFIAEPSIAKTSIAQSCPSRAVHRDIAEPSIAPLPSHFLQAVHHELSITASSSCHHPSQAVHCFIAEPSSALLPSRPLPSRPLQSNLLQAVQRFISELSIVSRHPSRAVHCDIAKPSIATSPSRPELYRQAVQCFITELSIAKPSISEPSIFSRPLSVTSQRRGTAHHPSTLNSSRSPNHPLLSRPFFAVQRFIADVHCKLNIEITPSLPALNCRCHCFPLPSSLLHCPSPPNAKARSIIHQH